MSSTTQYERHWDEYSKHWDEIEKAGAPTFLGDEWGTAGQAAQLFKDFLLPWLASASRVLEIGPGGGKYTVMAAPHVHELIALDASQQMLTRTAERAVRDGHTNVRAVKGNGLDLSEIEDESMDVAFSFDVFVHIAPADTYNYLREMRRVLKPGGVGSLTLANILSRGGFEKFITEADRHRGGNRSAEQFGYLTPTIASRFLFHLGFSIIGYNDEFNDRDFALVFRKDDR